MTCPHCSTSQTSRRAMHLPGTYRTPRRIDGATFRTYRCLNPECDRIFMTEERAIGRDRAEALEERLLPPTGPSEEPILMTDWLAPEEIEALERIGVPTDSSEPTPDESE